MRLLFIHCVVLALLSAQFGLTDIPQTMSYQGLLTNASGVPVADGNYSLTFKLYSTDMGSVALWTETHPSVAVIKGIFNVILGSGGSPLTLPFDQQYFLGVTVGAGSELTPRVKLTAAAYSLNAQNVSDGSVTAAKIASGQVVKSINNLKDDVTIEAGANIAVTKSGQKLTIAATGGGGGEIPPDNSVTTAKIVDGAVTGTKLAENSVTSAHIVNGTITPADVAFNFADSTSPGGPAIDLVSNQGVDTTDIADNAVTLAKLLPNVISSINSVSNDGGNIELWPGENITIEPNDNANTITISAINADDWHLIGNAGTNPAVNFLGTTDNKALELRVNSFRALRLEPHASSPNIIAGHNGNWITSGIYGATIGGGGESAYLNRVTDRYGVVGGGSDNQAGNGAGTIEDANYATVGGGFQNTASGNTSTVSGGGGNLASGAGAAISGGMGHSATGVLATIAGGGNNNATGKSATIGGGHSNMATADYATIAGGGKTVDSDPNTGNRVTDDYGTVSGGGNNQAGDGAGTTEDAEFATVGGGYSNSARGYGATVAGGYGCYALAHNATVGGGSSNYATAVSATVGGGYENYVHANYATVGGGQGNNAPDTAGGSTISGGISNYTYDYYCAVGGGQDNKAGSDDVEPENSPYATIGGGYGNKATAAYATIAGGGRTNDSDPNTGNRVTDDYGTVGGGGNNQAGDATGTTEDAKFATVGGGFQNTSSGFAATVGGGNMNYVPAKFATVGGGGGNYATGIQATVGGGWLNYATGYSATVGGGFSNTATGVYTTVGGGYDSHATSHADFSTISGGFSNLTYDNYCAIGGGLNNKAGSDDVDSLNSSYATIAGGGANTATGEYATISGGGHNTASGYSSTVAGGVWNEAGGQFSLAAGRQAKAGHDGCFVWGDNNAANIASTAVNQFMVRASGGVYLYTNSGLSSGMYLGAGGSGWNAVSDRNMKNNIREVNTKDILSKLNSIPISQWSYKTQDPSIEHIGPMAQDWDAAFGLGDDNKSINSIDSDGVALAAIQGLYEIVREKDEKISDQQSQISALETRLAVLEELLLVKNKE